MTALIWILEVNTYIYILNTDVLKAKNEIQKIEKKQKNKYSKENIR